MNNSLVVISDGIKYIVYALILSIISYYIDFEILGTFFLIIIFVLVYIYRNDERDLKKFEKNSLYSPVDGTIVSIEKLENSDYAYEIEVNSNYSDVSILRVPFDSKLASISMKNGARLCSDTALYKDINESIELVFSDANNNKVKVKHILKRSLLPFNIYIKKLQLLRQTFRYGVLPNGVSKIYIPKNFRLNVKVHDRVKASETLLGHFISIP